VRYPPGGSTICCGIDRVGIGFIECGSLDWAKPFVTQESPLSHLHSLARHHVGLLVSWHWAARQVERVSARHPKHSPKLVSSDPRGLGARHQALVPKPKNIRKLGARNTRQTDCPGILGSSGPATRPWCRAPKHSPTCGRPCAQNPKHSPTPLPGDPRGGLGARRQARMRKPATFANLRKALYPKPETFANSIARGP